MRRILGRLIADRRVVGGCLLALQLMIVMYGLDWISMRWSWLPHMLTVLSLIIVIWLVRKYDNPTYKISWIIVILLLPLFGGLFYLLWGNTPFNRARTQHKYEPNPPDFNDYMRTPATEELAAQYPRHAARARYIASLNGMPAWTNTEARYFRVGEEMFAAMCEELERAKKFIFFEYFIIEEGVMWDTILEILKRKVREGVDVRVIYDDVGSIATLPPNYDRYLISLGIRAVRFNRFVPTLNTYLNYRNHRKMMIIDGNVGFMGGINLADEYINKKHPFGEWKDTAVMLKGEGVHNFTQMFLQMWNVTEQQPEDYQQYLRVTKPYEGEKGYSIAYGDNPMDTDLLGEEVYVDILRRATRYVHIMTPYLVLDDVLLQALCNTAKSGVEVRLILPEIPDKRVPNYIAKSFYPVLLENGVEIYHFTPGFIHAKSFVSDNIRAVVGSINLDFRSLCHHFECALYMEDMDVVTDIEKDFSDTLARCRKITFKEYKAFPLWHRLCGKALRILAPLM